MSKVRVTAYFDEHMLAAIDAARGDVPRANFIAQQLRRLKTVRRAADRIGVDLPEVVSDDRGWPKGRPRRKRKTGET